MTFQTVKAFYESGLSKSAIDQFGDLAGDNSVTTATIDDDAVTTPKIEDSAVTTTKINQDSVSVDGFASSASVSLDFATWTTIETMDVEVDNPVPLGSSILVQGGLDMRILLNTNVGDTTVTYVDIVEFRILDDGDTPLVAIGVDCNCTRTLEPATDDVWLGNRQVEIKALAEYANLVVGTNTFKFQVQNSSEPTPGVNTIAGEHIQMMALHRKR